MSQKIVVPRRCLQFTILIVIACVSFTIAWNNEEEDPPCPFCPEGDHCEHFLVNCSATTPCKTETRCVPTKGITCANVRCAGGRCYMLEKCDASGNNCNASISCGKPTYNSTSNSR